MVQICRAGDLPLGGPRLAGPTTPHYPRWVWPFDRRAREARAAQRFAPREEPSTGPVRGAGIGRSTLLEYPARSPPDLQVLRTAAVELTPRCSSVRAPLNTTCTTCSRKLGMISRTQLARYVVDRAATQGPSRGCGGAPHGRAGIDEARTTGAALPHCALGAPGRSPMTQRRDQPAHVAVQPSGRGRWHGTGRGEVVAMLVGRVVRSTGAPITPGNSLRISSFLYLEGA